MTDIESLRRAIEAEAEKRGWLVETTIRDNGDFTIRFIDDRGDSVKLSPPDLGIHVQDGIGSKDKVGG